MLKAVEIKWDVTDNEMDDEACEILESLPTEMIIPEGMTDLDEISDWLSDETGYCHDAASSRSLGLASLSLPHGSFGFTGSAQK